MLLELIFVSGSVSPNQSVAHRCTALAVRCACYIAFYLCFRRYLPKLKGFPSRYIYEPWNAPESVQKAAKCIIGVDYPKPMVNHAETSRLNIERMKQIYQQLSRYRGLCKYQQLQKFVSLIGDKMLRGKVTI